MVLSGTPQPSPNETIDISGLWEEREEGEIVFEDARESKETMSTAGAGATGATTSTGATSTPVQPKPRVGGLELMDTRLVPWTGGSNVLKNLRAGPKSTLCYRPTDFKNRFTVEDKLCTGLAESERLDTPAKTKKPDTKITLLNWVTRIRDAMETGGMDTVFRYVDLATETEVNMLVRWSQLPLTKIQEWVKHLVTGIPAQTGSAIARPSTDNTPCPNDIYNLEMSARFLRNSIVPEMLEMVQHEIADKTGPEVLAYIIRKHQVGTGQAVRKLVDELQELKLSAEPREDVETFSLKVEEVCGRIYGTGNPPDDLNTITAARYMFTTVTDFKHWAFSMFQKCNSVDLDPWLKPSFEEIIVQAKVQFQDLRDNDLWPPALAHKEDRVTALAAQVQVLERKVGNQNSGGNGNNGGNGGNRVEHRTCRICNKKGHISYNCPEKDSEQNSGGNSNSTNNNGTSMRKVLKTPPAEGESLTKQLNGKTYKWCKKCRSWRTGPKAHTTEEHVSKKEANGGGSSDGNSSGNVNYLGATGQLTFCGMVGSKD